MKLIIIGNGFDLHHGLKTSYAHYKQYLEKNAPNLVSWFEQITEWSEVPDECRWTQIEAALNVDFRELFDNEFQYYCDDVEGLTERISTISGEAQDFTVTQFVNWLVHNGRDASCAPESNLNLNRNDYYISFNYTNTLQRVYSVPNEHVFHVHGSLDEYLECANQGFVKPETIHNIIQFGTSRSSSEYLYRELINTVGDIDSMEGAPISDFCGDVNFCTKNVEANIRKLDDFLKFSEEIEEVVVMGHSLGVDDLPYFERSLFPNFLNRRWKCYWHDVRDEEHFVCLFKRFGVSNCQFIRW